MTPPEFLHPVHEEALAVAEISKTVVDLLTRGIDELDQQVLSDATYQTGRLLGHSQ